MERQKSPHEMSEPSQSSQLWRRFRHNIPAVLGMLCLLLAIFLAVFAYGLVPDKSTDANQQDLRLIAMPPGTRIDFLTFQPHDWEASPLWQRLFVGESTPLERLPVSDYTIEGDSIYYQLYGDALLGTQVVAVASPAGRYEIRSSWYPLGTDIMGRDLLSRLLLGLRVSLGVGFIAVLISISIGTLLGAVAAYYKGWVDQLIGWFINVVWSIPSLLLVIAFSLALGKGMWQVFLAVGLTMWVDVARIVRGQVLNLREQEYVLAARAMGFGDARIIFRHLLPNVVGPIVIIAAGNFATAILVESGLSFLGLGVQPPTPSLGMMIKEHYPYIIMDAAYLALVPGLVILLLVLAFNLFGNGLSDAFDSKVKMG